VSKANKAARHKEQFREAGTQLDRLIEGYGEGRDLLPDGNVVSIDRIASELVGRYRHLLRDDNNVSFDGPLYADIKRALEAAEMRKTNTKRPEGYLN
jgi:hypothetical protein